MFSRTFLKYLLVICFGVFPVHFTFSEARLYEVFPNTDNDALYEYISLQNNTCTPLSLDGYSLSDASGKVFTFTGGILAPQEIFKFFRPETKITLNNENETLFLKGVSWNLIQSFSYATSVKNTPIRVLGNDDVSCVSSVNTVNESSDDKNISWSWDIDSESNNQVVVEWNQETWVDGAVSWVVLTGTTITSETSTNVTSEVIWEDNSSVNTYSWITTPTENISTNTELIESTSQTWGVVSEESSTGILVSSWASVESNLSTSSWSSNTISSSSRSISIYVQSGLDENNRCYKNDCAVNLEFPSPKSQDRCEWNFWWGVFKESETTKCNPSYIHYGYGNYSVILTVCTLSWGVLGNCSTDSLDFEVLKNSEIIQDTTSTTAITSIQTSNTISWTISSTETQSWQSVSILETTETTTIVSMLAPKILFIPDSKGRVAEDGKIFVACPIKSKKTCVFTLWVEILGNGLSKEWLTRWILPNKSKQYTKTLKNIVPKTNMQSYFFEIFSPKTEKVFRYEVKIKKELGYEDIVDVIEEKESNVINENTATSYFSTMGSSVEENMTQTGKISTKKKASKIPSTSKKWSSQSWAIKKETTSKSKSSSGNINTTWKTMSNAFPIVENENANIKILILIAASILAFWLGLSMPRLFLPQEKKSLWYKGSENYTENPV